MTTEEITKQQIVKAWEELGRDTRLVTMLIVIAKATDNSLDEIVELFNMVDGVVKEAIFNIQRIKR